MANNINQAMEKDISTFYHEEMKTWVSRGYALTAFGKTREESVERLGQMIEYSRILAREREMGSSDIHREG